MGFLNWIAYVAIAPLEVTALMADIFPWLTVTAHGEKELSLAGLTVAIPLLLALVVLNLRGIELVAKLNVPLAVWKLAVPAVTIGALALTRFDLGNFTDFGGFAPGGIDGVLGAVASGGCVVAYLGSAASSSSPERSADPVATSRSP